TLLRIWLTDMHPPAYTFYSDGSHALVTGSNPWTVSIMDSLFGTVGAPVPPPPTGPRLGNFHVTVTVALGCPGTGRRLSASHPCRSRHEWARCCAVLHVSVGALAALTFNDPRQGGTHVEFTFTAATSSASACSGDGNDLAFGAGRARRRRLPTDR